VSDRTGALPSFPRELADAADAADARDLRAGGQWTRRQRAKNDVLFGLALVALAVSRALPLRVLHGLGRGLGVVAHALAGDARRIALANVARVFPDLDGSARRAFVRRSFATMGELLADAVALLRPAGGPLLALAPEALAVFDEARREGRGVVFASAHLGPWERVAASLVAAGVPFTALARESYDPRFTRLYTRLRGARGVRVVWRAGPGAVAGIVRTLKRGEVLGVPMDLRSRVASCDAYFLGHRAPTAVGPARIALRTGAAVVVGTVALAPQAPRTPRTPGGALAPAGTTAGLSPPGRLVITATRIPTDGLDLRADGAALALTERINQELSRRILALPHAWVWMHERWTAAAEYDANFG
jgi:Kdo2-lipid IVA lauroyltransferase/acyltransferase